MTDLNHLDAAKLLQAVAAEKDAMASSLVRYQALIAKLAVRLRTSESGLLEF